VPSSNALRTAARIALVAGAAGSVLLMMRASARQPSILLILLFTGWVLSPFVALALANVQSANWQPITRTALYGVMLGVSFISLSIYTFHALIPGMKAGFIFLVVPAGCWVLIVMVLVTAAVLSRAR
jgi:hypothetical protein